MRSFQTCNAGRAGAQPYRATRADTPFRSDRAPTLAVFRQERAGICASVLTKPGKGLPSCFRLTQIRSSVGGCSPVDWTYDGGLRGSASAILDFLSS